MERLRKSFGKFGVFAGMSRESELLALLWTAGAWICTYCSKSFFRMLTSCGGTSVWLLQDKTMRSKVTVGTLGTVEPSEQGLKFLSNCGDHAGGGHQVPNGRENVGIFPPLLVHPEGDMLQAMTECAEVTPRTAAWGRGWADPVVRAQRLAASGRARKGKRRKKQAGSKWKAGTVRGRLAAKLSK